MNVEPGDPQVDALLDRALVLRLALSAGDRPYLVPLCFGYDGDRLYFHSAARGKKLEMLAANPQVCFEVEEGVSLLRAAEVCRFSMRYRSVIGFGRAKQLADLAEKRRALDLIVRHYGGDPVDYPPETLRELAVFAIQIEEMTYKAHKLEG